jgi:hypothetical protein
MRLYLASEKGLKGKRFSGKLFASTICLIIGGLKDREKRALLCKLYMFCIVI